MKKQLFLVAAALLAFEGFAQTEMSSWTATGRGGVATSLVTDYQALGINPSNLGWTSQYEEKTFTLGLLEGSYSVYSEALTKPEVKDNIINYGSGETLTYEQKVAAAQEFTNAGFAINIDVQWLGAALTTENAGGFAFGVKERFQWYSELSEDASDILFLGMNADYFDNKFWTDGIDTVQITSGNPDSVSFGTATVPSPMSEILGESKLSLTWLREYNFSYGTKIVTNEDWVLYAGAGIKYIQGLGMMDIQRVDGKMTAFSAMTPGFGIDYGSASSNNPSAIADSTKFTSVGAGFGFDFGLSLIINQKIKFGAAITDIGNMTWDGNVYSVNDTLMVEYDQDGIDSYNIIGELGSLNGDDGALSWEGVSERETKLPTRLRLGGSILLGEKLEVGADVIMPMNDSGANIQSAVIGFGGDFKPIPWLRLSAGVLTGGNYAMMIPVGIAVAIPSGSWEFGVASRDAVTFFSSESPTVSLAAGILRFRF